MFTALKTVIWTAGTIVVAYFVLGYFGYTLNLDYFNESKAKCQEKLKECSNNVIHEGIDNARCDFECIDPKIIIKKKQ